MSDDLLTDVELSDVELFRFQGKLRRPLVTARGAFAERESIIVRVHATVAGLDVRGYGEAAPLDGWGTDSLSQARLELARTRDFVQSGRETDASALSSRLLGPSARFALSTALLDCVAHARGKTLRHLLEPEAGHSVALNATIGCVPPHEAAQDAATAWEAGFRTMKVKVGDLEDVARAAAVRAATPDAALRLDANATWSVAEARVRLERFAPLGVEYIEQPVADADSLATLRGGAKIAIAADESAHPLVAAQALVASRMVDVVVLKPSLCGSWFDIIDLVRSAQSAGIVVVFSSAIESAVGRFAVAQAAAALLPADRACGLATGWFEQDVRSGEEPLRDGRLCLGSGNGLGFVPRIDGLATW